MDASGWVSIIAAIGLILAQITQMILSYLRDKEAAGKLKIIEKQTDGDLVQKTAIVAAEVVVKAAESASQLLVHTATAAATAAATAVVVAKQEK